MLLYVEFYRCLTCKINICSYCENNHDNNHKKINYDEKNYICINHGERYKYYCSNCNLNICSKCESMHKSLSHNIIKFNPYRNLFKEIDEIVNFEKDIKYIF
jgi:hypothetical protein